jgi:hypothetical protein
MKRDRFVPGNICHAPNETAEPDVRAFCRRFADFIVDAMVVGTRNVGGRHGAPSWYREDCDGGYLDVIGMINYACKDRVLTLSSPLDRE